ncbi:hypothetical protein C8A03DRAFT_29199 [Achaetomium macrosporum]|uniref:AMP-activated protein kinase glycogen-binding domain-containing protein n=1 Tax=Achaetomium macrosporum TaxID=79813 RepID=A0AAN7CIB0_9PEZI|nr:hypothetical protein C8A03DRAFT_29199 [Achaetomium macrosporum]
MATARIPAVITYHKPGTRPPVYVAGTFSEPPWQPHEMDCMTREDGEYDFTKEVYGEPGSKIQYKFRIGDGDWWVLKDDGPTATDSAGNTNHVLEVKTQEESPYESSTNPQSAESQEHTDDSRPSTFASVAAKQLQPSLEGSTDDRSGTGTPISARVAAEVADSAELLHEEVPEREKPEGGASSGKPPEQRLGSMSEPAETATEVADTAETLDNGQTPTVVLDPPSGGGHLSEVPLGGGQFFDDQEESIVDKSPLFAHECVGMYEPNQDVEPADEEEMSAPHVAPVADIDPDEVDLNDPTLERFPSNREEIIDTVRKLETGLEVDEASFDGSPPSPVINPSRRGTEDITGNFLIAPPQAPSPSARRSSKKSPRESFGSCSGKVSLHSISEAEEPVAEEGPLRPAVVFSNPLKARPEDLKLPAGNEDEGVAFRDGVSPKTVKPAHQPIASPPSSPKTHRKSSLAPAEAELDRDKERSMRTVTIHSAPKTEDPDPKQTYPATAEAKGEGHAEASPHSSGKGPSESSATAPAAPSYQDPSGTGSTTPSSPTARRRSYAEVARSPPPPTSDTKPTSTTSQAPPGTATTTATQDHDPAANTASQLRKRPGPSPAQEEQQQRQPAKQQQQEAPSSAPRVPAVHPKNGGGWIRAFFRLIFVDLIGRFFRRLFGWVWRRGKDRERTETETETETQT